MHYFSARCAVFTLVIANSTYAEDAQLAELFNRHDLNGTMVIASLDGNNTYVHNDKRATQRLSTASTFKIPNSLIALDENIVQNEHSVVSWDGTNYEYASWNKDQTLKSAYQVSCVWCYQEFAKQVGKDKYKTILSAINYGHINEQFNLTTFWLDNGVTISALEQIDFLKNLYHRSYPFKASSYDILSKIMLEESTETYHLRAKTGWAARVSPQVGWYVGYIETQDNVWFFATNIHIKDKKALPLRKQLTLEGLSLKGIL